MYKVIDKKSKKQFGVNCLSIEEAECLQSEHNGSVIVNIETKEIVSTRKVNDIKLHPIELKSEVACCIAYCIGATYDNVEAIANTITDSEIEDCINRIRSRMCDT